MTAGDDAGDRIRTALVTGGTGGMGRVIAAKLAADGFDVAVAYAGSVDLADATVKEIAEHGRRGARRGTPLADDDLMILQGGIRAALVPGSDGHRFLAEELAGATPQSRRARARSAPALRRRRGPAGRWPRWSRR
jgi:NAD(P)-dependent dehydrogenase (short-subunit alcohol dehydrogenase family)